MFPWGGSLPVAIGCPRVVQASRTASTNAMSLREMTLLAENHPRSLRPEFVSIARVDTGLSFTCVHGTDPSNFGTALSATLIRMNWCRAPGTDHRCPKCCVVLGWTNRSRIGGTRVRTAGSGQHQKGNSDREWIWLRAWLPRRARMKDRPFTLRRGTTGERGHPPKKFLVPELGART